MDNPLEITVTLGSFKNTHKIYFKHDEFIRSPYDITIKYYNRGKYAYRSKTKPRNDTQIYINGKYWFVIGAILKEETKEAISNIIRYCYARGLSIEEIKREFKIAYQKT